MVDITDGRGIYRQDAILGPFDEDKCTSITCVPQIEEIRAVEHDGEIYYSGKDLVMAMKDHAHRTNPTLSVQWFIRGFIRELITARR